MNHWYIHIAMPAMLGLLSLWMIAMGLRALVTRRPYIFSARWLLLFMLIAFAPNALMPLVTFMGSDHHLSASNLVVRWMGPVMFVVLMVFFSVLIRGYIAMGVTETSMREALFAALARLGLPHEETLGAIKLPTVPAELQVAVQAWVGTAQLKPRTRASRAVAASVASGMSEHFRTAPVRVNLVCPIAYVVMGSLMAIMDVALVIAF
jgi:hypothetical protein